MIFEKFSSKHLTAVKGLSDNLFDDGWTQKQFEDELAAQNTFSFVMIQNQSVVGFLFSRYNFDECELLNIAVQKQYQNKHFASLMLQKLIDFADENCIDKIFLEVKSTNAPALGLYKKFGFLTNRVRKGYYKGIDALEMILDLSDC